MPTKLPMIITTYTFIVISLRSETFWRHRKTVFFSQCHKSTDTHTSSFTFISRMKCWLYMYSIRGQIIMSHYFHIRKESIIISIVLVKFSTIVRWMNKIPSERCHENIACVQTITKLWLVPSAKQRRDPCSGPPTDSTNYRKCVSNCPSTWLAITTNKTKAFFNWPIVARTQNWVHSWKSRTRISALFRRRI